MQVSLKEGDSFHGRYRILKVLGAGGSGSVYLALQEDANRKVALKVLNLASEKKSNLDRFMREFKLLSNLQHHNIVTFYSAAISAEGDPYAVCEYLKGKTLYAVLQESTKLSWPRLAKIVIQICDAMAYAHEHSVVHRDLKPGNIMLLDLPEPDTVKVIDFGLGKVFEEEENQQQKLTGTGMLMGTPHYMSPEQSLGLKVDTRSDIYALACIIYECLCARKLFDAYSPLGILHKHANEDPAPILEVHLPVEAAPLSKILEKMLAKDPEQRYQSMAVLKTEIEKISNLQFQTSTSIEDANFETVEKKNFPVLKFAIVALLFLLIAAGLYLSKDSSRKKETLAGVELSPGSTTNFDKRQAHLQGQIDRYEERLKTERNPERRKALIDMLFRRSKELRFEQNKEVGKGNFNPEEERTILTMLKYCPEMDDSSLMRSELWRSMVYFELHRNNIKKAQEYSDKSLQILEGQQDLSREYVLRALSTRAIIQIRLRDYTAVKKTVHEFSNFLAIPTKDTSNPVYSRFPSFPVRIKSTLGKESLDVMQALEEFEPKTDNDLLTSIEMLADMADFLTADSEFDTARAATEFAMNLLKKVSDKSSSRYKSLYESILKTQKELGPPRDDKSDQDQQDAIRKATEKLDYLTGKGKSYSKGKTRAEIKGK